MDVVRITELQPKTYVEQGDYIAIDNQSDGTKKVQFTNLLDDTLSQENKIAPANVVGDEIATIRDEVGDEIATIRAAVGSPLKASTVAQMTDTNKIYVYVGSESGYTNGNWYYWNGSAWTSGGVYNSVAVVTDPTLTLSGVPADAKATGDEITNLKDEIIDINSRIGTTVVSPNWTQGAINSSGQIVANDSLKYTPTAIKVTKGYIYTVGNNNVIYRIKFYANEPIVGTTYPTSQTINTQTSYTADADGWIALIVYNANADDVVGTLPASVTLGSLNDRTAELEAENDAINAEIQSINEDIQSAKTALGASERYKAITYPTDFYIVGKCVNGNTVGNTITFTTSAYRSVIRAEIPKGCEACHIIYAVDSGETICAVVTDANDTVVKIVSGSNTSQTYKKVYVADVDAKYIYWTAYSTRSTHILFEYDKYQIYEGEKVALTNTGLTEVGETIEGYNAIKFSLSSSSATTDELTFEECGDMTIGLWLKMPVYEQAHNTSTISIVFYNSGGTSIHTISLKANCLQMGEWVFVKTPFTNASQYRLATKAVITLSFVSGYTDEVTLLISPFVKVNNFCKAVYIFNQDSFWGASETCGFYNYLINNNIPWTVTGVNNSDDPVSDDMWATLEQAYADGLLDVGIYTNEQPADHPIANNSTSFIAVQDAMNYLIDSKIESGFYPVSIGCGTNYMPPAIKKSIDFSGFKAIRGGTTGGSNAMGQSINPRVIFISADISSKSSGGGYCMSMYHGVSTDPSSEHDSSLYVQWSSVKSLLDTLITARDNHEVLLMNMKQFAEFVKE